jgi:peptidoglycan/LPS O-acetylase OafA/YrhL
VLGIAGLLSNRFVALSLILSNLALLAAVQTVDFHPRIEAMTSLAAPFSVGAAIYVWRDQVPYSALVATVLWIFALGLLKTDLFAVSLTLALAYTALFVVFHPFGKLLWYNRLGDYSYGTYVFAFPIQQLVASFGIVSPIMNMLLAFPLVLAMAIFSWHFVEAPALKAVRARSIDPRTSP